MPTKARAANEPRENPNTEKSSPGLKFSQSHLSARNSGSDGREILLRCRGSVQQLTAQLNPVERAFSHAELLNILDAQDVLNLFNEIVNLDEFRLGIFGGTICLERSSYASRIEPQR